MIKTILILTLFLGQLIGLISSSGLLAQEYIYPNKIITDRGLIEYRPYTLEEARRYINGHSSNPFTITDWGPERWIAPQNEIIAVSANSFRDSIYCGYGTVWGRDVYFIRSTDQGANWGLETALGDSSRILAFLSPQILLNGANLILGTMTQLLNEGYNNPAYFKSTDHGATWGHINLVFPNYYLNLTNSTSFSNVGSRIYCSYINLDRDSIYVVASTDWGTHWNLMGQNVAYTMGVPQPIKMASANNIVHLVWVYESAPVSVHYSRSTNGGLSWSSEIDISQDSLGAQFPYIAVQDSQVVICWMGYKNGFHWFTGDLFIRQSFDDGTTWDSAQSLTDLHYVSQGSINIVDSLIEAVWQDERYTDTLSNSEIFCLISTDKGQSWGDENRISNAPGNSFSPVVTSTESTIHVIWGDYRSDAPGLYYRSNNLLSDAMDEKPPMPNDAVLLSAYPNPFNGSTTIRYSSDITGPMEIYNLLGQNIRTIELHGKEGSVVWDGTDSKGGPVSSGVYFVKVKTTSHDITAKLILLR